MMLAMAAKAFVPLASAVRTILLCCQDRTVSAERAHVRITGHVSVGLVWRSERRNGAEGAEANRQSHAVFVRTVCEAWAGQRVGPGPCRTGHREKRSRNDEPPKNRRLAGCVFVADPCGYVAPGAGMKDAGPPGTRTARTSARSGSAVRVTGGAAVRNITAHCAAYNSPRRRMPWRGKCLRGVSLNYIRTNACCVPHRVSKAARPASQEREA